MHNHAQLFPTLILVYSSFCPTLFIIFDTTARNTINELQEIVEDLNPLTSSDRKRRRNSEFINIDPSLGKKVFKRQATEHVSFTPRLFMGNVVPFNELNRTI